MCKLFDELTPKIKEYCIKNQLSFDKAKKMSQCWGKDDIILQYYDKNVKKDGRGLLNETPLPIVLKVYKNGENVIFEQTEHTRKYLAI